MRAWETSRASKNHASTAGTSLLAIATPVSAFAAFGGGFFFVEHVLGFDGHVDDIGVVVVEFGVWDMKRGEGLVNGWKEMLMEERRSRRGKIRCLRRIERASMEGERRGTLTFQGRFVVE